MAQPAPKQQPAKRRLPVVPKSLSSRRRELVIITGLSGSGKGTVLKALEDLGYYAVDNLPISLIDKFAELTGAVRRAANSRNFPRSTSASGARFPRA